MVQFSGSTIKFTLRGEIAVSLHLAEHAAELRVRDTGTGIPASEMPRLFERFHRVENAQGRTHEGSGIGLALVQELVRLHGGSVVAESTLGEGSTFIVTIPLGSKHLPADQVGAGRTESPLVGVELANPYVEESLRWLPNAVQGAEERVVLEARPELVAGPGVRTWSPNESERPRILVADDNADMRQYVARLLSDHFRVDAVADGVAAVEAVRRKVPDLILSDVMMPRLDGFGLLREMRSDARTSSIPFILLSARAGEESRVEGLQAGADDYLVKPFSARELLARVSAQLQMARIRQESSETLRRSEERLRMALTAARMVAWQYDPGRDQLIASENAADVFGLTTDFSLETSAEGGSLIHPEDLERHISEFRKVVAEGGSYFSQFRMVRPKDDSVIWLEERAQAIGDREAGTFQVVGVVLDITERKRAEMELRDARSRLESTLAAGEVGTWEFDPVNDAMHADPNLARMFGVSAEDAAGGTNQTYLRAVHPEDRNRVSEIINQALNVGEAYEADYRLVGPGGSIRWVIARGRVERDEAGNAVRLPGVVVDITAQRQAEERFAQLAIETERERRLFDTVLTSIPDYIFVFSPDGRFVYANKALLDLWGLSRDEAIGKTMAELKYPWDVEAQILRDIDIVVETGRTVEDGTWYMSPSGATGYYEYTLAPVFGTEGDVVQVAGTARDILDRKRAEEAVRRSEERLRLIVENAKDFAIITLDQAGVITGWNSGAANIFGYQESEILGRDGRIIFTPEDREQGRPEYEMEQALQTGRVENERWHINKAGERFWASGLVTPLKDGETAVGFLKIMRDMTEARRSHEMLEKQAEALREADRRKDEFLATLAHELRNPLAPVRNGLQIMRMAGDDRRVIDEARTLMERQVSHMVRLIDDLMDVSRITRGKLKLRRDRVELATVVHSAVEASRPLVEAAEHELAVTMPTRPIVVDADPTRLAQVISNLLNNAAKYTESGGNITLAVEREASDVVVTVRDNGVGIPAEMLPHVFDMFTQVDRSLERSQGGLGVGLTLVKRLVEMHSGSVEARSGGPGRGSGFEVRLPLAAELVPESSSDGNPKNSKAAVKGRKILVVDDNYDSAKTLARLLKMMGHEARIAHDGGEAVTQADDYRPDLIILDIGLPVMNGYDVATAIRSLDWGKNISIVALTGWGQEGDRRRSREAGIDRHLVKPLDPSILESLLTNLPESRR
ncbi:PAS domain S-box protein [Singulisphaera sp. PoT]|uniref:PAS domain S-box protein n=1 Tax=Singulisphaera sp. PoT TaxID=3411797 RepID=UPI003BF4F1BB